MNLALLCLGLGAGALTTLAGQGGGLFLLLACSVLLGPHAALAITAPSLLVGNLHRAALFRQSVDWPIATPVVAGALPGALLGGLIAGIMPPLALQVLLVLLTVASIARALGWLVFDVPRWALVVAGLVVGTLTGTAGGAGVLLAPILLSVGLTGRAFVGTSSVIAFAMHVGRVVAYGSTGLFTRDLLVPTVIVAVSILVGNALGERIRARIPSRTATGLEYGTLVVCVVVSLAGALRAP